LCPASWYVALGFLLTYSHSTSSQNSFIIPGWCSREHAQNKRVHIYINLILVEITMTGSAVTWSNANQRQVVGIRDILPPYDESRGVRWNNRHFTIFTYVRIIQQKKGPDVVRFLTRQPRKCQASNTRCYKLKWPVLHGASMYFLNTSEHWDCKSPLLYEYKPRAKRLK
jgi:hypothetical protein